MIASTRFRHPPVQPSFHHVGISPSDCTGQNLPLSRDPILLIVPVLTTALAENVVCRLLNQPPCVGTSHCATKGYTLLGFIPTLAVVAGSAATLKLPRIIVAVNTLGRLRFIGNSYTGLWFEGLSTHEFIESDHDLIVENYVKGSSQENR